MHHCLPVAPVTFAKRCEGAVLTLHSIQLLDEAGTWLSGSVRAEEGAILSGEGAAGMLFLSS